MSNQVQRPPLPPSLKVGWWRLLVSEARRSNPGYCQGSKLSSAQPLNVLSATDFILSEDGSTPIPVADPEVSNRWSLASWITLAPNLQTIGPNETKIISVVIAVPDDALPGGHYAMITHQPTTANAGSDVVVDDTTFPPPVSLKSGHLALYVKVEGPINESAFIHSFTFSKANRVWSCSVLLLDWESIWYSYPACGDDGDSWHVWSKSWSIPNWEQKYLSLTERKFDGSWDKIWGLADILLLLPWAMVHKRQYHSQGLLLDVPCHLVVAAVLVLLQSWLLPWLLFADTWFIARLINLARLKSLKTNSTNSRKLKRQSND